MATFNPDSHQSIAARQSSEFGKWTEDDYFPSHEEISYAMSLGKGSLHLKKIKKIYTLYFILYLNFSKARKERMSRSNLSLK